MSHADAPTPLTRHLQHCLQRGREALLWKLDGLDEDDLRRPLVAGGAELSIQSSNLPSTDAAYWQAHRDQVEAAARRVAGR